MIKNNRRFFKYICSSVLATALFFGLQLFGVGDIAVSAERVETIGEFTYSLDDANTKATVTGYSGGVNVIIPDSVTVRVPVYSTDEEGNRVQTGTEDVDYDVVALGSGALSGSLIETVTFKNNSALIEAGAFSGCSRLREIDLPAKIKEIGDQTFYGCTSLLKISIPSTVTKVGSNAFYGCINLTEASVYGDIGSSAFEECINLETVIFKGKTASIGDSAFTGCESLSKSSARGNAFVIPKTVKTIGEHAFDGCISLVKLTLSKGIEDFGAYSFYGCTGIKDLTIPTNAKYLGASAFENCTGLESVKIQTGVEEIGEFAFAGCENIKSLILYPSTNKKLKIIGDSAFKGCSAITKLELPEALTYIGSNAFEGLNGITEVIIPKTVETIKFAAFAHCTGLKYIEFLCEYPIIEQDVLMNVPTDNLEIKIPCGTLDHYMYYLRLTEDKFIEHIWTPWKVALAPTANNDGIEFKKCTRCGLQEERPIPKTSNIGYYFDPNMTATVIDCSKDPDVTTVVIPKTVRFDGKTYTVVAIGSEAFRGCTNLKNVTLPETITLINNLAFEGCTNLKTMVIPKAVETINQNAFMNCTSLDTVVFSKDSPVTTIEKGTFKGCSRLKNIDIPNQVTDIREEAFAGTALTEITIPRTCEKVFDNAFNGCSKLKTVTFKRIDKPDIDIRAGAFAGIDSAATFKAPCEKAPLYTDALKLHGNLLSTQKVTAPNHRWSEWLLKPPATIKDNGVRTRECYNCGEIQTEDVDMIVVLRYSYNKSDKTAVVIECTKDESVSTVKIPQKTVYDSESYNVVAIGAVAFRDCTNLKTVTIPAGITQIGSEAFKGCSNIKSITVPDSVTALGTGAFSECTTLSSAKIPDRLTEIPDYTFSGCVALKSFKMPGNVEKIGKKAFFETGLTAVTIPSPGITVDAEAFASCSNLKAVTIMGRSIKSEDPSAFRNISDAATFKIPCGMTGKYSKLLSGKTIKENAHKWGKWEEDETGAKERTCTVCGQRESDTKNVTGLEYDFIVRVSSDWNKVLKTAKNIKAGTLNVDLRAKLSVPSAVLSAMKGKDVYMNLELNNGIMWQLHGKKISAVTTPLNLNAKAVSGVIPKKYIQRIAGSKPYYEIQIPSRADFGLTATFIPKMDISYYGKFANLFYYNKKLNRMEFIRYSPVEDNGYAYFDLNHASEYLLVISDEPMGVNVELGAGVEDCGQCPLT